MWPFRSILMQISYKKKKDILNSLLYFIKLWLSYAQKFALMVVLWKLDWLCLNVESGSFFRK